MKNKKTKPKAKIKVGVIGLGIMGSSISSNLQKSGFDVHGVDLHAPTRKKMKPLLSEVHADPAVILQHSLKIISSLPSSKALVHVCHALCESKRALKIKGTPILMETSTLTLQDKMAARDILLAGGIHMIDAPLSGTGAQAKTKDLSIYASGDAKDVKSFSAIFDGFSRTNYNVGEFGNGMKMKLVANLLVAIHNVAAAEGILFGKKLGLDTKSLVSIIGDGAGSSRMFQVRGPMMVAKTWSQATMKNEVWQKDMSIIYQALDDLKVPAPLFAACIPIYNAAMSQGHALDDTAAVYAVLERMAGEH
jgi:3-hydroxyisobutyrate dehydrogenase-like beta-hydroxyacid dehydrogenase